MAIPALPGKALDGSVGGVAIHPAAFVRKGGKRVTIPLAPRTSRALDLYLGERTTGPIFLGAVKL